jgi:hypothetical protein
MYGGTIATRTSTERNNTELGGRSGPQVMTKARPGTMPRTLREREAPLSPAGKRAEEPGGSKLVRLGPKIPEPRKSSENNPTPSPRRDPPIVPSPRKPSDSS